MATDSRTSPLRMDRARESCSRMPPPPVPSAQPLRSASRAQTTRPRLCRGPSSASRQLDDWTSARRVTARVEAGDHRALVVGRISGLLRAGWIESGLAHRPAVALIAVVLRLFLGLAI